MSSSGPQVQSGGSSTGGSSLTALASSFINWGAPLSQSVRVKALFGAIIASVIVFFFQIWLWFIQALSATVATPFRWAGDLLGALADEFGSQTARGLASAADATAAFVVEQEFLGIFFGIAAVALTAYLVAKTVDAVRGAAS